MKSLQKVATPPTYIDRHKLVVEAKNIGPIKTTLETLDNLVTARFQVYNEAFENNTLHALTESTALQAYKAELQSCYKNSTIPLRSIFQAIKAQPTRILKFCPYCGMTLPKTYDHYVPEGRFPEFSAHALNLIPCCGICNSSKKERWRVGNTRIFINYYLDPIPDVQYLQVQIQTAPRSLAVGAVFSLVRHPNIVDDQMWNLIDSHYRELDLLNRYKEEVNNEVSDIYDTCCSHIEDGGGNIPQFLLNMSERNGQVFGVNHWRVVLWTALAQDPNFIDLLNN